MKNELMAGSVIGLLSGLWLLILYLIGNATFFNDVITLFATGRPFGDTAILLGMALLIPVTGLYLGLRLSARRQGNGRFHFNRALMTCSKILIAGGLLTSVFLMIYWSVTGKGTVSEFTKLAFGASLAGLAAALILSFWVTRNRRQP